ncbi:uncharacterized protein LOC128187990 [Crassostrea angulata]|uniref:uncharacterized protein LOC128187990 n=1 Tax=Magallana angulata TaxID=2784310 RepID=UPI0022B139F9|nr:uncharacterized protein LOC128187990 [Crassostrea angulata]
MSVRVSILAVLSLHVCKINGGCHVNDWPHSCQANFRIGPQRCEPCESGSYGCNCSEPCPYGTYGQGCYHVCDCSDEQFCDPLVGCTNNSRTTDITTGKVESTPYIRSNTRDVKSTPSFKSDKDQLTILTIVGITTGTLLSIGVISNVFCFCFLCRRKSDSFSLEKDVKSTEGVLELGTNEEDIDVHSYLTISDRSVRMYAAVHYDEAEDKKSSPSLSLHSEKEDLSIKSKTSPSSSFHRKKEEDASIKSDTSKILQGYLTPVVTTVEETKSDSQRSSDYEDFQEIIKCTENFESPASLSFKLGTLVKIDKVQL